MKLPFVSLFCCGCTLRTGCLVIGWLWAAEALIPLIYLQTWSGYSQTDELVIERSPSGTEDGGAYGAVRGFLVLYAILTTVKFIVSLCLIYGTSKGKRPFLLSWLYCCSTILAINVIAYLAVAVIYFAGSNAVIGIGVLLAGSINCVWGVYSLVVVKSHYFELKEDSTRTQ